MPIAWSLITVSYNNSDVLRNFWSGDRPEDVEWIVVDNASSDDSVETARDLGASIIELTENLGFSAANNLGMQRARGEYVGFINPDVRVDYSQLTELGELVDAVAGLVSPQLLNLDSSLQPNGRGAPLFAHKVMNRLRPPDAEFEYRIRADGPQAKYVFWLTGAVVLGRAETFRTLAGWSERFFLYYEDTDLSIRAWKNGFPVVLTGAVRWTHGWARETSKLRVRPWLNEARSMTAFYRLYPELLAGGRGVPQRHPLASDLAGKVVEL